MNEKEIVRVLELTVSLTDKLAAKDAEIAALCKVVENLEAENQRLKAMVHVAEETGVEFCELEDGGVGCAIPMTEELRDALESSVALTDKCRAQSIEIADYKARLNLEIESRAELQRQLAETQKDTARLEWLVEHRAQLWLWEYKDRDSLDAAMRGEEKRDAERSDR